ncbi:MAG: hypothetical protein N3D80_01825 [Ignavibacterium album]|jgi:uncharacterized tellurite resistance protein B-like protein|uniref:Co-chaperone DjlA N-terminal domain-containing protein n=1 Tax=Ignavibacterium album TaxID=591197 RepID=A0A7V2ZLF3_9BACT|nr:hypothetical protein [Ignavibacterium album]MCX8104594.1 hypothetical protein [Ignavibacterium album]
MQIPVQDRSNYLKGLFITAKLDKQLNQTEKDILKKISDKLGFANDFYEETIRGLLANKYLSEEPIKFSDKKIAESFINDAIKLACADGQVTESETNWLKKTAEINGISSEEVENKIKLYMEKPSLIKSTEFALMSII